jgi:hypothetical protein
VIFKLEEERERGRELLRWIFMHDAYGKAPVGGGIDFQEREAL